MSVSLRYALSSRLGCRFNLYSSFFQLIIIHIHVFCSVQTTENLYGCWIAGVLGNINPLRISIAESGFIPSLVWPPQSPCTMEWCCPREQVLAWDDLGGWGLRGWGYQLCHLGYPFSTLFSFVLLSSCSIIFLQDVGGFQDLGWRIWVWFCKWAERSLGLL